MSSWHFTLSFTTSLPLPLLSLSFTTTPSCVNTSLVPSLTSRNSSLMRANVSLGFSCFLFLPYSFLSFLPLPSLFLYLYLLFSISDTKRDILTQSTHFSKRKPERTGFVESAGVILQISLFDTTTLPKTRLRVLNAGKKSRKWTRLIPITLVIMPATRKTKRREKRRKRSQKERETIKKERPLLDLDMWTCWYLSPIRLLNLYKNSNNLLHSFLFFLYYFYSMQEHFVVH